MEEEGNSKEPLVVVIWIESEDQVPCTPFSQGLHLNGET